MAKDGAKTDARPPTLIDAVFQHKTKSFKPQAVKKKAITVLLSCQHRLISTEQISCASLTNLISFFFPSSWRFPQPHALFRQKTPQRFLNPRFDGQELPVSELSGGANTGWAWWSTWQWVHLPGRVNGLGSTTFAAETILSWGIFLWEKLRRTKNSHHLR